MVSCVYSTRFSTFNVFVLGTTEDTRLDSKERNIPEKKKVNSEFHHCCPTSNQSVKVSPKVATTQEYIKSSDSRVDSPTRVNSDENQNSTKAFQPDNILHQKSTSTVSTPVRKRTRPSSGFDEVSPSVFQRQQPISNMLPLEWAFLQQLKWCQSKGNYYYSGWLSSPSYSTLPNPSSFPTCLPCDRNKIEESHKSSKGRPPSELPLSRMRFKALQQACLDRGISPNGTVAALKQRLRDWVSIKMTGKPSVPQQRKRRIENEHPAIQGCKTV